MSSDHYLGPEISPPQITPETVDSLLITIDEKIESLELNHVGTRYEEFNGHLRQVPTRITLEQIPIQADSSGKIAEIRVKPQSVRATECAYENNYTSYCFYSTEDGVEVKKEFGVTPLAATSEYEDSEGNFDREKYVAAVNEYRRKAKEQDRALGLDIVYEAEAQEILEAVRNAKEDPQHKELLRTVRKDYERQLNRPQHKTRTSFLVRNMLRRLMG